MKCNSKLFYKLDKDGNRKKSIFGIISPDNPDFNTPANMVSYWEAVSRTKFSPEYVVCDGEIKFAMSIEQEPYFGGLDMSIHVSCRCNKCGRNYSGLNEFNLEDFVNNVLDGME